MKRLSDVYSRTTHRDDAKVKKNVLRTEQAAVKPKKSPPKPSKSNKVNVTNHASLSRTLRGTRK